MTKVLKEAIGEVESLPAVDQEEIGRRLLSHVEKLRALRTEIDRGTHSLDAKEGKPLDIPDFIQDMRHGKA